MADAAFSQSAIEVREGRRRAATGADERRQPASVQRAVACLPGGARRAQRSSSRILGSS